MRPSILFLAALIAGAAALHAQELVPDTVYLAGGGVLFGEATFNPAEDVFDIVIDPETHFSVPIEEIDAVYPARSRRVPNDNFIPTPSPAISMFTSLFVPGLGLITAGHPRGFLYLGVGVSIVAFTIMGAQSASSFREGIGFAIMGFAFYTLNYFIQLIDTPIAVIGLKEQNMRLYPYETTSPKWLREPQKYPLVRDNAQLQLSIPF